jgi:Tol biopolymer transport system component
VRWSPDGKSLLFYREGLDLRDESAYPWLQRVYTVSAQGGRPTLRFTAHVVSVGWSPDGKKIIYTGSQRDGPAGARIHIYDMARHSDRPLHLGLCAHTSCIDADWQRVGNR